MSNIAYTIYNHSNFDWKLYILSAYARRDFLQTCKRILPADYPKDRYVRLILREDASIITIPMASATSASKAFQIAEQYQLLLSKKIDEDIYCHYFGRLKQKFELIVEQTPYFLEWFKNFQIRYSNTIDPEVVLTEMKVYSPFQFHSFVRATFCKAKADYLPM